MGTVGKLALWAIRRYINGPGRSWIFTGLATAAWKMVRSARTRREVIDLSSIGPGKRLVIEHLQETHSYQLREEKRAAKRAKADTKTRQREQKQIAAHQRAAARSAKAEERRERRQRRAVRRQAALAWTEDKVENQIHRQRRRRAKHL